MEVRTNDLFKSYLQDTVISKTPSPEPQVTKFRDNLRQCEENILDKSISNLCTMMENCQLQLQMSNDMISKFLAPDCEFIVVQKNQLREFLDEFKQEFNEFKNEVKTNVTSFENFKQEVKPSQSSQKNIFNKHDIPSEHIKSSQKSIFSNKPLTPPASFEAMLEGEKLDTFAGKLQSTEPQQMDSIKEERFQAPTSVNVKTFTNEIPTLTYKIEKRRKAPSYKTKRQSPRKSVRSTSTAARMRNTQHWLDSLPIPPRKKLPKPSLNNLLTSTVKFKRRKSSEWGNGSGSENESIGRWSCRSIRTYKSGRKRGANFVKIDRVARSESGWGQSDRIYCERNFKSEY